VQHGHIQVNGKKASIPSMVLVSGDVITVKNAEHSRAFATANLEQAEGRGLSPWLALDKNNFEGRITHVPSREEIAPTVNEQLIVELYSK
jgi:small subunit ribosomal protein S4